MGNLVEGLRGGGGKFHQIHSDLNQMEKRELVQLILNLCKRSGKIREEIAWELGYEEED